MRLCTVRTVNGPIPAVRIAADATVAARDLLGRDVGGGLAGLLDPTTLAQLSWAAAAWDGDVMSDVTFDAPLRHPGKILGIGLNYRAHAGDLGAQAPRSTPASFFKADHTIIGPDEEIRVPSGIGRVTAEAELGLVIGRRCYRVGVDSAMDYVAGIVAVLDQTAEEILLENPRYLTRVKNYPTFFAFGPDIITMDEVRAEVGELSRLTVTTVHNTRHHRSGVIAGMTFSPAELISFHSAVMPFDPGDIISTGTPGAVAIRPGDVVACRLGDGLSVLTNAVVGDA